ncbi:hypothetical protein B0H14DRAFT_2637235 [Mycena olivaceomarginata]|nr:hypothetical protein B0H14DRAFT_2637235 [Mycena olivaceomarginata]
MTCGTPQINLKDTICVFSASRLLYQWDIFKLVDVVANLHIPRGEVRDFYWPWRAEVQVRWLGVWVSSQRYQDTQYVLQHATFRLCMLSLNRLCKQDQVRRAAIALSNNIFRLSAELLILCKQLVTTRYTKHCRMGYKSGEFVGNNPSLHTKRLASSGFLSYLHSYGFPHTPRNLLGELISLVLDKLAFTLISSSASQNGQETLPSHVFFTQYHQFRQTNRLASVGLGAAHAIIAAGGFHVNPNDRVDHFRRATVQLFDHGGKAMKFVDINGTCYKRLHVAEDPSLWPTAGHYLVQ